MPVGTPPKKNPPQKPKDDGVSRASQKQKPQPVQQQKVGPEVPSKSKEVSEVEMFNRQFYFDGKTMSQLYNPKDLERLVNYIITDATDLNVSLAEAYILYVYNLFNKNIKKVSVPNRYADSIRGIELMEQLTGLANLLQEQSKKTHTTFIFKNDKLIDVPTTENKSSVTLDTIATSNGFVSLHGSIDGSLPDESPAVSEIKKKIGYTKETGNVMTNEFVDFLKNWQSNNQITPTGVIDTTTVINLYPEKEPKK
jgi:hypothetical protein